MDVRHRRPRPLLKSITLMDGLLLAAVLVWGLNYTIMKRAFQDVPALAFNAIRFSISSAVFLIAIRIAKSYATRSASTISRIFYTPDRLTARDRWNLLWLGLVGHTTYQFLWVTGLTITTASNGALIMSVTPVAVGMLSSVLGHERIRAAFWIGAAISAVGVYLVVGREPAFAGATLTGDVLMLAASVCWAAYTVGGARMMARHSPLYIAGTTMAIGTVFNVVIAVPSLLSVAWPTVPLSTWLLLIPTSLLAGCFAFIVWYAAVQVLGPSRTSVYSNLIPLVAMASAAIWLGESITAVKIAGVTAVLGGVALTRVGSHIGQLARDPEP